MPGKTLVPASFEITVPVQIVVDDDDDVGPRSLLREIAPLPAPSPKALYKEFLAKVEHSDVRLVHHHRRLVAALLVEHVYIWNTLAERHRTRNALVRLLGRLGRNSLLKTLRREGGADEIRREVLDLLQYSILAGRPRPDITSLFEDSIRHFVKLSKSPEHDMADLAPGFATYLRSVCRIHFRPTVTPVVEIPGVDRIILNGLPSIQADVADRLLAVRLTDLLRAAYGSSKDTIAGAADIISTCFPASDEDSVSEEALRAQRWRGTPEALGDPLVRLLSFRNLDALATALE